MFEVLCVVIGGIIIENSDLFLELGVDFLVVLVGVWCYLDGVNEVVCFFNV